MAAPARFLFSRRPRSSTQTSKRYAGWFASAASVGRRKLSLGRGSLINSMSMNPRRAAAAAWARRPGLIRTGSAPLHTGPRRGGCARRARGVAPRASPIGAAPRASSPRSYPAPRIPRASRARGALVAPIAAVEYLEAALAFPSNHGFGMPITEFDLTKRPAGCIAMRGGAPGNRSARSGRPAGGDRSQAPA